MHPLSLLKYYRRNKRRLALFVMPVMLCMIALYIIQSLMSSYMNAQYMAFVETRKAYTSIQAWSNPINLDMIDAIAANENTEKIVPCVLGYTEMSSILDQIGVRVYLLGRDDLVELMDRMGVTLVEGRLPIPGTYEIILHRSVAVNKALKIGDSFGNQLDPAERLPGCHTVVGLMDGPVLCAFAPLETWQARNGIDMPQEYGILVYARAGKLEQLNKFIEYLPLTGNEVSSYRTSLSSMTESEGRINGILNVVYVSLLIIISLCVGFLTYLFYMGRAREFAILNIIGYTRSRILRINLRDILVINAATLTAAVVLSTGICLALNAALFSPTGIPLPLFDGQTLLLCLCVALVCVIAETAAVAGAFGRMEAIDLLESEN